MRAGGCWLDVMKLLVRLMGLMDTAPTPPGDAAGRIPTLVDEETEVTTVLVGGAAQVVHDKLTGRGSMVVLLDDGIDGRERDRARGLSGD